MIKLILLALLISSLLYANSNPIETQPKNIIPYKNEAIVEDITDRCLIYEIKSFGEKYNDQRILEAVKKIEENLEKIKEMSKNKGVSTKDEIAKIRVEIAKILSENNLLKNENLRKELDENIKVCIKNQLREVQAQYYEKNKEEKIKEDVRRLENYRKEIEEDIEKVKKKGLKTEKLREISENILKVENEIKEKVASKTPEIINITKQKKIEHLKLMLLFHTEKLKLFIEKIKEVEKNNEIKSSANSLITRIENYVERLENENDIKKLKELYKELKEIHNEGKNLVKEYKKSKQIEKSEVKK